MSAAGIAAARSAARSMQARNNQDTSTERPKLQHERSQRRRCKISSYEASRPSRADYSGVTRVFIEVGDKCHKLTRKTASFDNFIFVCIALAVLLIGVQSYNNMEGNAVVLFLENVLFWIFVIEVILKLLSESIRPWMFYRGPYRRWNIFDASLCVMSMPMMRLGSAVQVLRVARLMRLLRLVQKSRRLRILAKGVLGGVSSMGYILLLMGIIIFTYSLIGVMLFGENDPFHFRTFDKAVTTLISTSTLDSWTDVYYINYYGCHYFHSHLYVTDASEASMPEIVCRDPNAAPVTSSIFFLSYVFMTALTLVQMFVGAITIAMTEAVNILNEEEQLMKTQKALKKAKKKAQEKGKGQKTCRDVSAVNKERQLGAYLLEAFDGKKHPVELLQEATPLRRMYSRMGDDCLTMRDSFMFRRGVLAFICFMGMCLAADTYEIVNQNNMWKSWLECLNTITTVVFTVEFVIKLVAEKFKPWKYFRDPWNIFDFGLVVFSYVPVTGNMKMVLRMLRLFAVMKVARDVPEMRMIIDSLSKGALQLGYIGISVFLVFYFFAMLGIILFKNNDPTQFGNLHTAVISLFQYATLDGWTHSMLTGRYGCMFYNGNLAIGFNSTLVSCGPSNIFGGVAVPYFAVFVVIGSWVMLNLFIGVITTSMTETTNDMLREKDVIERATEISIQQGLSPEQVIAFRTVFQMLDVDDSQLVTLEELELGLQCAGKVVDKEMLAKQFNEVDDDGSGEIDQAEFIGFMVSVNAAMKQDKSDKTTTDSFSHSTDQIRKEVAKGLGIGSPWLDSAEILVSAFENYSAQKATTKNNVEEQRETRAFLVKYAIWLMHHKYIKQRSADKLSNLLQRREGKAGTRRNSVRRSRNSFIGIRPHKIGAKGKLDKSLASCQSNQALSTEKLEVVGDRLVYVQPSCMTPIPTQVAAPAHNVSRRSTQETAVKRVFESDDDISLVPKSATCENKNKRQSTERSTKTKSHNALPSGTTSMRVVV